MPISETTISMCSRHHHHHHLHHHPASDNLTASTVQCIMSRVRDGDGVLVCPNSTVFPISTNGKEMILLAKCTFYLKIPERGRVRWLIISTCYVQNVSPSHKGIIRNGVCTFQKIYCIQFLQQTSVQYVYIYYRIKLVYITKVYSNN